ncbi:PREDICTED: uncharacterized protein LOC104607963 [Nelumbo nucifera]|uniref:Uncharacterized protein LOC104607963 n=1 Tax=Nelumbo nucifera TaxID=4432 RepID=A0A1U8AVA4_NELNU|nr:PREDICTED: uncharacterized protein LOC104607963 [Nelumbo nucifera]XP_010272063.1 PREDICTED: uncharacterized protein LOC104607963 [Nelumbo nucifera]XP_010272064.1 PREDICTED: uncharacterized protein LOC104607963 [Nelumbo nucifera]
MSRPPPQVTITLGRTGQVVKKPGPVTDNVRSDYVPSSGSKRSVRERLGSNFDNPMLYGNQPKNKRQRNDSNRWSPTRNDLAGAQVGKDDLRFKLMQKHMSRRTRSDDGDQNNMDLREKLSRTAHCAVAIDTHHCMPAPKATNLLRQIPPTRSADDLLHMDSLRKSYSAWSMDGLRHRSPDRILGNSRGFSPPMSMAELRQTSSIRQIDASRPSAYMSKEVLDNSRPTGRMPLMTKPGVPLEAAKPVAWLPPANGIMQKSSCMGEEPPSVASLLHSLGLGKYAVLFQAEEVDMTALKQMGDNDLKEMGIPMGPRKKILLAVLPRLKRQQP